MKKEKINLKETKLQSVSRLSEKEQRERIPSSCYLSGIEKNKIKGLVSLAFPKQQNPNVSWIIRESDKWLPNLEGDSVIKTEVKVSKCSSAKKQDKDQRKAERLLLFVCLALLALQG